ncbi:NYN domain-containing protein [Rubrobacter aplysinae]|uniref:NYN domain-containing protein n=1 Tax=Rubrobacter aplysinae TaxID=909625 RepID=UPI00064C0677|nr:NYN domain-containing protein [Rubrobacter aplysinae]
MPSYLILDGYNLIGALDRYREPAESGFDSAREQLVNDALKASGWTGREIFLVFDAHGSPEPEKSQSLAGGAVRVVYSAARDSADDVIERLAGRLEGDLTVYTADFALQRTALARGARRATPAEFAALLDELPALTSRPSASYRSRISDHLSPDARMSLERIRRKTEEEDEGRGDPEL